MHYQNVHPQPCVCGYAADLDLNIHCLMNQYFDIPAIMCKSTKVNEKH